MYFLLFHKTRPKVQGQFYNHFIPWCIRYLLFILYLICALSHSGQLLGGSLENHTAKQATWENVGAVRNGNLLAKFESGWRAWMLIYWQCFLMCIVIWQVQTQGFEITGYMKSVSYFIDTFFFLTHSIPKLWPGIPMNGEGCVLGWQNEWASPPSFLF